MLASLCFRWFKYITEAAEAYKGKGHNVTTIAKVATPSVEPSAGHEENKEE